MHRRYSRLQKPNLMLVHDKASGHWMDARPHYAYRKVKWKHLPKYARHAIMIINIAGPDVWVMNYGEMRVAEFNMIYYTLVDPIKVWEHCCFHNQPLPGDTF